MTLPEGDGNLAYTLYRMAEGSEGSGGSGEEGTEAAGEEIATGTITPEEGENTVTLTLAETLTAGDWKYYLEVTNDLDKNMLLGADPTVAASAELTLSVLPVTDVTFDISKGDVLVTGDIITGKTSAGETASVNLKELDQRGKLDEVDLRVTGTTEANNITFNKGETDTVEPTIILDGANINGSGPAIEVTGGGVLNVGVAGKTTVLGTTGDLGVISLGAGTTLTNKTNPIGRVNFESFTEEAVAFEANITFMTDGAVVKGPSGGAVSGGALKEVHLNNILAKLQDEEGIEREVNPTMIAGGVTLYLEGSAKIEGSRPASTIPGAGTGITYVTVDTKRDVYDYSMAVWEDGISAGVNDTATPSYDTGPWAIYGENVIALFTGSDISGTDDNRVVLAETGARVLLFDYINHNKGRSCVLAATTTTAATVYVAGTVDITNSDVPTFNRSNSERLETIETTVDLIGIPNDDGVNPSMTIARETEKLVADKGHYNSAVGLNMNVHGVDLTVNGYVMFDMNVADGSNVTVSCDLTDDEGNIVGIGGNLTVDGTSTAVVQGTVGNKDTLYTVTYYEDEAAEAETKSAYITPVDGKATLTLVEGIFTHETNVLVGWKVNVGTADAPQWETYSIGETIEITGDTDIYAIWLETPEGEVLPQGYSRLEYIESDGYGYIALDYIPNNATKVVTLYDNREQTGEGWLYGVDNGNLKNCFAFFIAADTSRGFNFVHYSGIDYGKVLFEGENSIFLKSKNTAEVSYNYFKITNADDPSKVYETKINSEKDDVGEINPNAPMYVFANNRTEAGCAIEKPVGIKLYTMAISEVAGDTETPVMNMVPVKNPAGTKGLYDTLGGTFYPMEYHSTNSVRLTALANEAKGLTEDVIGSLRLAVYSQNQVFTGSITLSEGAAIDGSIKGWWDKETTETFTVSGKTYTAPQIDTIYMKDGGAYVAYAPGELPLKVGAEYFVLEGGHYSKINLSVMSAGGFVVTIPDNVVIKQSTGNGSIQLGVATSVDIAVTLQTANYDETSGQHRLKMTRGPVNYYNPYTFTVNREELTGNPAMVGSYTSGTHKTDIILNSQRAARSGFYEDTITFTIEEQ